MMYSVGATVLCRRRARMPMGVQIGTIASVLESGACVVKFGYGGLGEYIKEETFTRNEMEPVNICCTDFLRASESGTDNDGYMSLIRFTRYGEWHAGMYQLKPIAFCPWCGKKLENVAGGNHAAEEGIVQGDD
jgi:hypothetical protein